MKINDLKALDSQAEWLGHASVESLGHITDDSRTVQPGSLFLCYSTTDFALKYIVQALDAGALIIAAPKELKDVILPAFYSLYPNILWVFHDCFKQFASKIAAVWFPGRPSTIVAVTGTNGKTSTVQFLYQLWSLKGIKAASLGTLGLQYAEEVDFQYTMTTPSPLLLYQTLDYLYRKGITHVALEASSHGLHQARLQHIHFAAAGFTNLTQDHLDYHQTMENYFQAKKILFTDLLFLKENAVLNADDPYSLRLKKDYPQALTYSLLNHPSDIKVTNLSLQGTKQYIKLEIFDQEFECVFPFLGDFLLANALCALGLFFKTVAFSQASDSLLLAQLTPVKGRLQWVGVTKGGAQVFIDYAHTPHGLENVLKSLKALPHNRLMVVFGCGGNRDTDKRRKMGEIANSYADWVGITDDNPRTEDPRCIRQQIQQGCPKAYDLGDRETAIAKAIHATQANDILLVAGKGHETTQIIGLISHDFDDQQIIEKYLK